MSYPLVSVVVPTWNSERTLAKCLESVKNQTYRDIEVIVADSFSKDKTVEIAKQFNVEIIQTRWGLLGARYLGLQQSKGELILMLDSDQILEGTAIHRAVEMISQGYDMLCLEEHTYQPKTWVQKLLEADRKLVHKYAETYLNPLEGVVLARFFRREILEKAFKNIPRKLLPTVIIYDHTVIYYEAYKITQKVGILPKALWHIEPASLIEFLRKNYRYGRTARELLKNTGYQHLLKKAKFRKSTLKTEDLKYWIQSCILLSLKGAAYWIGKWTSK